jgi:hypothetical protein
MRVLCFIFTRTSWLLAIGLILLGGCQPTAPAGRNCPMHSRLLAAPRDTFDLLGQEERDKRDPMIDSLHLPFAHQQRLLQGAYFISGMLADSVTPTPYGGGAYYYGQVRPLLRSPRASCHRVIYAMSDEFVGLFLVIGYPDRPANLYLSGNEGSSWEDEQFHYDSDNTRGFVLNDSTVLTKTGRSTYAFRRSQQRSYTDTISRRYHIDYRASRFQLLNRDSVRTYLPGDYFD